MAIILDGNVGAKNYLMNAVKARLADDCKDENDDPIIKHFGLYDGQFDNEGIEDAFVWPAIFFFFRDMNYKGQGQNIQTSDTTFTLFIGVSTIDTEDMGFLDLVEKVNYSLQGFEDPGFIPTGGVPGDEKNNKLFSVLYRMAERQSISRDNVRVWQIDYYTLLRDANTDRRNRMVLIPRPLAIEVVPDPGPPFIVPE